MVATQRTQRANGLLNWGGAFVATFSYEPAHLSAADRLVFALHWRSRIDRAETRHGIAGNSMPRSVRATSQAARPGEMQTCRRKPSLWAFLNARNERASCFGVLCMGISRKRHHISVAVARSRPKSNSL